MPTADQPSSLARRQSMAFFHNINPTQIVECIPSCTSEDLPPQFPPIISGDFLMEKHLASTGGGDNDGDGDGGEEEEEEEED